MSDKNKLWHMCWDISGLLRFSDRKLSKLFVERSGREVREWLNRQVAEGKEVIPLGKACEGFSYQTGCPGHAPEPKEAE